MEFTIMQNVGLSGIEIAFRRFGKVSSPPVFLSMGAGAQMISWPEGFVEELVKRDLQIIQFDSRDTGLSTHFTHASIPDFTAAMSGDFSTVSYSLSDMAADTIGLMKSLGFASAHFIGASMGGMVAQTIAIEYPSSAKSLTSIMSTTGNPAVGQPDYSALAGLGMPPWDDREAYINWRVKSLKAIGSPDYPFDEKSATNIAGLSWDRDHDQHSMTRQALAVLKSGDRTQLLGQLNIPALILHGASDKMINVSGGKATAEAIPGSKLVIFEKMGHGLPQPLWVEIVDLIASHVHRADSTS